MKYVFISLVRVYQYLISPLLGSNCKFHPTCSSYCIDAIKIHGAFKGLLKSIHRIVRCNPFSKGGVDLPN